MSNTATALVEQFFGSLGRDGFFERFWPRTAYSEPGDPNRLPAVFRAPLLQEFEKLATHYRGPCFFFDGAGSMMRPLERPALEMYRAGHTIYLGDVAPFIKGSRIFLRELETELGVTPGCSRFGVFASPRNDGAAVHYDTNDVFSIQLRGQKKFNIAPVKELVNPTGMQYSRGTAPRPFHYPQMRSGFPDPTDAEYTCVDMSPGTVLFMPRGTWHYTEASEDSVAVSIIVDPPPAIDTVLEQIKFTLLQEPRWREPLYGAWSDGTPRSNAYRRLNGLLQELVQVTAEFDPQRMVDGSANLAYRLDRMNADTRFQVIPTASVDSGGQVNGGTQIKVLNEDLTRGTRETLSMTVDQSTFELVEWIVAQKGPFDGHQIAARFHCEFSQISELLKTLCRGELIIPLWFEPMLDMQRNNHD